MNNKYDALDWQSFSQKKNIEEIVKNTKEKKIIQIASTVEIAMAILSLLADTLFKNKIPFCFALTIALISVSVLVYLLIVMAIQLYNKNKPGGDIPDTNSMIDLFDNDICYYVLMAESYSDKINFINTSDTSNVDKFYFIETCFYINKAIYNLSITSNSTDKIYSIDSEDLHNSRKISYTRLKNIFNILDGCIEIVDAKCSIISDIDIDSNYTNLNKKYKDDYNRFKKIFLDIDPNVIG